MWMNVDKPEILVKFGNRLRQERQKQGLSQEALAARADLHRTYIGMIERAEKNVTLINIFKIAVGLNIEVVDLFNQLEEIENVN